MSQKQPQRRWTAKSELILIEKDATQKRDALKRAANMKRYQGKPKEDNRERTDSV